MLCIACGEATDSAPCAACGDEPRLDGRWSLLEVLGQGANGTTYKAVDADGNIVAAKESTLKASDPAKLRELVEREARVLRQLHHDGIPGYVEEIWHQHGRSQSLFLLQEHVDGTDLQRRLRDHRYDEEEVLDLLEELAGILEHLHTRQPPIVHRDVKPSNVMRRPDGRHVLLDFGSVRDVLKDAQLGGSTVAGTFGFMAPEQFAGDASPRSDLYGLGALAVALLTRQDPAKLQRHDRSVAWRKNASVSSAFAALIDELLAVDPARRPGGAAVVAARIAGIRRGEAVDPGPNAPWARDRRLVSPPEPSMERPDDLPPLLLADRLAPDEPEAFHQPPVSHRPAPPSGVAKGAAASAGMVAGTVAAASLLGVLMLLVFGLLSGGLSFILADTPSVQVIERPAPAAAPTAKLPPAPWPALTAEELALVPASPSCVVVMLDRDILEARDACPAPLRATAEDWLRLHIAMTPNRYTAEAYVVPFAPRPSDEMLLSATTDIVLDLDAEGGDYPSVDGVQAVRRVQPEYPDAPKDVDLAPMKCRVDVLIGADGAPDRLSVHDCPLPFHDTTTHAVAQWRWDNTTPTHTTVNVTYKLNGK